MSNVKVLFNLINQKTVTVLTKIWELMYNIKFIEILRSY